MPLDLRYSVVNGADYSDADLVRADMRYMTFNGGSLAGADLERADLRNGTFNNVSFRGASLKKADIRNATFNLCDFTDVNAEGVDSRNATGFAPVVPKRKRVAQDEPVTVAARGQDADGVRPKVPMSEVLHGRKAPVSSQGAVRPNRGNKKKADDEDDDE